jgi:hypothetical protein
MSFSPSSFSCQYYIVLSPQCLYSYTIFNILSTICFGPFRAIIMYVHLFLNFYLCGVPVPLHWQLFTKSDCLLSVSCVLNDAHYIRCIKYYTTIILNFMFALTCKYSHQHTILKYLQSARCLNTRTFQHTTLKYLQSARCLNTRTFIMLMKFQIDA